MRRYLLPLAVFIPVIMFFAPLWSVDLPALKGHINDYAEMISPAVQSTIESRLASIQRTDSTQIVIVTINSLEGEPIEEFGIRLAEKWKIGQSQRDNGVLLIASKKDRRIRIEVGRGLEGVLTDLKAGRIIDNIIRPRFKEGDYDGGFFDGAGAIISACRGEFKADAVKKSSYKNSIESSLVFVLIAMYMLIVFLSKFSRILGGAAGAVGLPILVYLLVFNIGLVGIIITAILGFILGIVLPAIPISGGGNRSSGGYWSGGAGSGGGFSGGGGSFGGGGSSGGW